MGDGKQDLAVWQDRYPRWRVYLSTRTNQGWRLSSSPIQLYNLTQKDTTFADVNADGLADALVGEKVYHLKPNPNSTDPMQPYYFVLDNQSYSWVGTTESFPDFDGVNCTQATRSKVYEAFGDVNGDGAVDVVGIDRRKCSSTNGGGPFGGIVGALFSQEQENLYLLVKDNNRWVKKQYLGFRKIVSRDSPSEISVSLQDINGDGLADLIRQKKYDNDNFEHYYQLSNGNGFQPEVHLGRFHKKENRQFVDIDGDKKQDLVWRNTGDHNMRYRIFKEGKFAATAHVLKRISNGREESDDKDGHQFIDISGDGRADHIRQSRKYIYSYVRNGGSQPDYTITQITNGMGAKTRIQYQPISWSRAYSSVDLELSYRYGINGQAAAKGAAQRRSVPIVCNFISALLRNCDHASMTYAQKVELEQKQYIDITKGLWDLPDNAQTLDNDNPVLPINGAIYVVTHVESSAPAAHPDRALAVDANATSSVAYQYAGARMQGGGRGFLGFQYLKTIDLQTDIKTTTMYRQDYPFTGAAQRTVTFGPDKQAMQYAENQWTYGRTRGLDGTYYYRTNLKGIEEVGYQVDTSDTNGQLSVKPNIVKSTSTTNLYDTFGNLTLSKTTTKGYGQYALEQVKTVTNSYANKTLVLPEWDAPSLTYSELGRLTASSMVTELNGQKNNRLTFFSYYDTGNTVGLLKSETIHGQQDQKLTTHHHYDAMGNEIKVVNEGWDGSANIQRISTSEYDVQGRYMDASYNHYGQRIERILERSRWGSPVRTQNLSGVVTTFVYDGLGRQTRRYNDSTKEVITNRYFDCQQGGCPRSGSYAIEESSSTGAQTIKYFDIVGRVIRESQKNFHGQMVYVDTEYDKLGRVVRVSEPNNYP